MEVTIMRYENHDGAAERAQHCPECGGITTHPPDCSRRGETDKESTQFGYDYSHLVGSPLKQPDRGFDAAEFDALLTTTDRILLRSGMHIAW
jgi:hypothetical protein